MIAATSTLTQAARHPRSDTYSARSDTAQVHPGAAVPADKIESVIVDDEGTVWALAVRMNRYVIALSSDGASSWTTQQLPAHLQVRDYPDLVVGSRGRAAILTRHIPPTNGIPYLQALAVTNDGGNSWSEVGGLPFTSVVSFTTAAGRLLMVDHHVHLWRSNASWTVFRRVRDAPRLYFQAAAGGTSSARAPTRTISSCQMMAA